MLVKTVRFGDIEVEEKFIFTFQHGLPGFPDEREFAFLPYDDGSSDKPSFAYLQSLTTPELTFLLVDPFAFYPDYEFVVDDATEESISTSTDNLPMVWSIGMVLDKIENMTINLVAPVLFNVENRQAIQMILDNNKYTTRHRVFPENIREEMNKKQGGEVKQDAGTEP